MAIVGVSCRFPGGATSPRLFWDLLAGGVDAITDMPADRFDAARLFDADPAKAGTIYTRWGGFLDGIDRFDAGFFGISPREASRIDPQQRLLLETTWEAFEDAGLALDRLAGRPVGVFIGISTHDYGDIQMYPANRLRLDHHSNTGGTVSIAANRVSYAFDLRGPSLTVDTACSSALTAVHLACASLRAGECEIAAVGGVQILLTPEPTMGFCRATMLSPTGRCHAFDASADGYVRSEGAGIVILKPLAAALADRDPIHAVILGTAINQDGRTSGLTVPSGAAQEAMLRQALAVAGVAAREVHYVEAHGTGTPVGDPIEASAIGAVMREGREPGESCAMGSVKANIGHLEAASGIAGLIKTTLALSHRQLPPSLHFERPNPAIDFDALRLRVVTELESWPTADGPATAGVNSFGFGGANAHVILRERPPFVAAGAARSERGGIAPPAPSGSATPERGVAAPVAHGTATPSAHGTSAPSERGVIAAAEPSAVAPDRDAHLLTISARSEASLKALAKDYLALVLHPPDAGVREFCAAAARRRAHHSHRLAVVGATYDELADGLEAFLTGETRAGVAAGRAAAVPPPLAFVFSGMGPQWWGMARRLIAQVPLVRDVIERCDRALRPLGDWSLIEELLADESRSRVAEADLAQVTGLAIQLALIELWKSWGITPDAVFGHSAGEMAAAYAAGVHDLDEVVRLAYHRSRLQARATGQGRMLAVAVSPETAAPWLAQHGEALSVAAINGPSSMTLSGDAGVLDAIMQDLQAKQVFARFLAVAVPYHSARMDPIHHELIDALHDLESRPATVRLVSEVTGAWATGTDFDAEYWWHNVREPVQFAAGIRTLSQDGFRLFLEVGPHPVLAVSIGECLAAEGVTGTVVPSLRRMEDDRRMLMRSLGALYVQGRAINWDSLYAGPVDAVALPTYRWDRSRHWFDAQPAEDVSATMMAGGVETAHPLLQRRVSAALPIWDAHTGDPRLAYLDAHRVHGTAVFPAAAFVEMALAAAADLRSDEHVMLSDVRFLKALFLPAGADRRVQVTADREGTAFDVHSTAAKDVHSAAAKDAQSAAAKQVDAIRQTTAGEEWTHHVSGHVTTAGNRPAPVDLAALQARCDRPLAVDACYIAFDQRGLEYLAAFQGLAGVWQGDREALGRVRLPPDLAPDPAHRVHPALLDAAFQLLFVAGPDQDEALYLPVRIDELQIHQRPGPEFWVHVRVRQFDAGQVVADLRVFDDAGTVAIDVHGLHAQRLEESVARREEREESIDDWLYEYGWQADSVATASDAPALADHVHAVGGAESVDRAGRAASIGRTDNVGVADTASRAVSVGSADSVGRADRIGSGSANSGGVASIDGIEIAGEAALAAVIARQPAVDQLSRDTGWYAYYEVAEPRLNGLAVAYLAEALRELGFTLTIDAQIAWDDVRARIDPARVPFARRLLAILCEHGVLRADDAAWVVVNPPSPDAVRARDAALLADAPAYAAEAALLRRCGRDLARNLRGERSATETLFADDAAVWIERFYRDAPPSLFYNTVLADTLSALLLASGLADAPDTAGRAVPRPLDARGLRAIEIGGGTGGTTAFALPALDASRAALADRLDAGRERAAAAVAVEYVFTDISPAFVERASARWRQRTGFSARVLDIERAPAAQGLAPHAFHVVIAANVLHATRDLAATLAHVRTLLAPGGVLLMIEITRQPIWLDAIFGLTDGWWRFTDRHVRADHPLLAAAAWEQVLRDAGFAQVVRVTDGGHAGESGQTVLVVTEPDAHGSARAGTDQSLQRQPARNVPAALVSASPAAAAAGYADAGVWLVFADRGGRGEALADDLRAAGAQVRHVRAGSAFRAHADGSFEIDSARAADLTTLFDRVAVTTGDAIRGVVDLWSLDLPAPGPDSRRWLDEQASASHRVVQVAQLLAGLDRYGTAGRADRTPAAAAPPVLWLITSGGQPVATGEAVALAQSSVWGLGRVLIKEQAEIACRLVDLDPADAPPADQRASMLALAREIATSSAATGSAEAAPADQRATMRVLPRESATGTAATGGAARSGAATDSVPARSAVLGSAVTDSAAMGSVATGGVEEEMAIRGGRRFVRRLMRVEGDTVPMRAERLDVARTTDWRAEVGTPGALQSIAFRAMPAAEALPPPGHVRLRIDAASINFRDVMLALGMIPGLESETSFGHQHLGLDAAGTIIACGAGVDEFAPGDAVVGIVPGAFASSCVTRADLVAHTPRTLTADQAAAAPCVFVTAHYALQHLARLAPGERVLIHAATGGVGMAALQIAQRAGAIVFATAGSPEKRAWLTAQGVAHVMDSRSLDFAREILDRTGGEGVDVVLNSLTGAALARSLALLKPYGRFLEIGKRDIYRDESIGLLAFRKNLSFFAIDLDRLCAERPAFVGQLLREVMEGFANGRYAPLPQTEFPMADVEHALRFMAQAKHLGKIVLRAGSTPPPIARDGDAARRFAGAATYVITGGLGGFGLAIARWLCDHGARHLVLMSRRGETLEHAAALGDLRATGAAVRVVRGDVASRWDVRAMLDAIRASGAPLRGIIHAAMVLDDAALADLDASRFARVMAPKIAGGWNLHTESAADDLDFFVMFSSIAALLGNPLQANYGAANAFLDALAHARRHAGLPGLSINWGVLSDVGYVARHADVAAYLDRHGYEGFRPDQALRTLGWLIQRDTAQMMAARINWSRWGAAATRMAAESPRLRHLVPAANEPASAPAAAGRALDMLHALSDPEARLDSVTQHLRSRVARILGAAPATIEVDRPLTELGTDSMTAVEVTTGINVDFGVELPAVKLLQGVSTRALAALVLEQLRLDAATAASPTSGRAAKAEDERPDDERAAEGQAGEKQTETPRGGWLAAVRTHWRNRAS
jgi:acyl transferase domain-containing protein/acyl carrier protein